MGVCHSPRILRCNACQDLLSAPLYATVFSGGAVLIEELTAEGWRRFRPGVVILIALAAGILHRASSHSSN